MQQPGPIIVIEDDRDDQELLAEAFLSLNCPRQVIFFTDGDQALTFIENSATAPFLILSDVNLPKINGFEIRDKIQSSENPKLRSVPYLFFTTGAQKEAVDAVYAQSGQGFFVKPDSMNDLKSIIRKIIDYWEQCYSPSEYLRQSNRYGSKKAA